MTDAGPDAWRVACVLATTCQSRVRCSASSERRNIPDASAACLAVFTGAGAGNSAGAGSI